MKEFLNIASGEYKQAECMFSHSDWVEIPKGKNVAYRHSEKRYVYFLDNPIDTDHYLLWQRSEIEYLMQGKNGERLMESVGQLKASKEKHSHYRKSVKHLDFIDPYRIAQLYDLHPCADHIAKKALCTGKRGHKDLMRDIQDVIDTAERWKQMIQEDQNAI